MNSSFSLCPIPIGCLQLQPSGAHHRLRQHTLSVFGHRQWEHSRHLNATHQATNLLATRVLPSPKLCFMRSATHPTCDRPLPLHRPPARQSAWPDTSRLASSAPSSPPANGAVDISCRPLPCGMDQYFPRGWFSSSFSLVRSRNDSYRTSGEINSK
ncbi:hypothetical protein LZ32DRAFT_131656 [Colletotrichum eremochloae]|nr:hypothetical protein LZ32DRAFT_131656 [Colletotrichum eremochloae]